MIFVADTNVLVRLFAKVDNPQQVAAAKHLVAHATKVVVPTVVFCELVWVLLSEKNAADVAKDIRVLLQLQNLVASEDEVLAGLRLMDAGGDFADGVIQYTGSKLAGGRSTFASFDRGAVKRLSESGVASVIPEAPAAKAQAS